MAQLYWQTIGEGQRDLVLLHGWGLNAEVWRCITERLTPHFRLHLVDLPGYGRSGDFPAQSLAEMANVVLMHAPAKAIWLGWSLGGLVASQIALANPERVDALITVASSPCFAAHSEWPGIKPEVLSGFQHQLSHDFNKTVERFLALQTLGTESAKEDIRMLKGVVLKLPMPTVEVLNAGLKTLEIEDLRNGLDGLKLPFLRLYGYLDGLVPRKVASLLDERWPNSDSYLFPKASHAPFMSHSAEFCEVVKAFIDQIDTSPQRG